MIEMAVQRIVVVSGPTGPGKTSKISDILETYPCRPAAAAIGDPCEYRFQKRRRRGAISVEMMGYLMVLGLVGLAIFLIFAAWSWATNQSNLTQAQSLLATIASSTRNQLSGYGTTTGLTTDIGIKGQMIPPGSAVGTTGTARNPWGGPLTLEATPGNTIGFDITFSGVPTSGCTRLAGQRDGTSSGNLMALAINGSPLPMPPDASTVIGACSTTGAGISGGNSITFTYGLL